MFEGRVEAKFADRAPRVMTEDDGRTEYWLYDGQKHYKVGLNAVVGKPLRAALVRTDALRRDAPRRVRHPRAHPRHGHQRHVRVGVLPVVARRVLRPALPARRERSRARACRRARRERLAARGVGGHLPGPHHPAADPVAARPGGGRGGDPPPTPAAASTRSRSPSCPSSSGCRRCTPATGTRSSPRARRRRR